MMRWVLAAALVAGSAAPALAGSAPAVSAGKSIFESHCAVCHKADGSGGMHIGPAVSADLRSPGLETTYHHSDALLLRAILQGKDEEGGNLNMVMPHWKGQLTEAQAKDVVAFIKTLCCHTAPESDESK